MAWLAPGSMPPSTGGAFAFSSASDSASLSVLAVNDAPTTAPGFVNGNLRLSAISPNTANPDGIRVADLLANQVIDVEGDAPGIAVTGLTGVTGGTWQVSSNGSTWQDITNVSSSSALLVASTQRIRFLPRLNFTGQPEIKFRVWDQTSGTSGTRVSVTSAFIAGSLSRMELVASVLVNSTPLLLPD